MTRSEMIARLVFAMGGRSAEELVFHEPTTGASSDIEQATKIARAMVTEYGMSARLGAVRYGREQGDPFLGRSMGNQPDYSLEVAHEIDEEVRKLIEAAHTEAWEILNTYRDVLDDLVFELLREGDAHPQGPRAHLRPGREAAADHRVQRLRRPHAVGQAADQDARRAGQGARRAVAAASPAASPRPSAPTRAATAPPRSSRYPGGYPDRPAAVVGARRTPRQKSRSRQPKAVPAQLRRASRVAPGHHARRADVAAARARSSRGACPRRRRAPTAARREREPTSAEDGTPLSVHGARPTGVDHGPRRGGGPRAAHRGGRGPGAGRACARRPPGSRGRTRRSSRGSTPTPTPSWTRRSTRTTRS